MYKMLNEYAENNKEVCIQSRINEYFQGSLIETENDKWGFNDEKLVTKGKEMEQTINIEIKEFLNEMIKNKVPNMSGYKY